MSAGEQEFWVNANATKHMVEYVVSQSNPYERGLTSQMVLTEFQAAVEAATKEGIRYGRPMIVGNYELIFKPSNGEGLNPVIIHALRKR